jgi:hypothetical protein
MIMPDENTRIDEINREIGRLCSERDGLSEQRRKRMAADFIAEHRVTRADVELSDGDDRPWFGHVGAFGKWLSSRPRADQKRFCEWNGVLNWTSDIIAGRLSQMRVHLSDLPE